MSGNLRTRINLLLPADKYRLLKKAGRTKNSPDKSLEAEIAAAEQRKKERTDHFPKPALNTGLPIYEKRDSITETLKKSRVCIITGETGSGKTTQLPLLCLLAGKGKKGKIGCTQPRRIAALTVADRLREEIGNPDTVGHAIRFDDSDSESSYIKVMTDGILLAETQKDPWLNEYETIIIDEAHERSLNIDFLLGILKTLLKKRRDLSVIITSATIDTKKFSHAFDNAPIIEVSGRMYPVETVYTENEETDESSLAEKAVKAWSARCSGPGRGDVLVFFPTEQDIREFCDLMSKKSDTLCLPLYARLPASSQKNIFWPADRQKVIAATNIAETSITVPGIKYVIDTGLARISSYSPNSRTTLLPVSKISRSSADQRKGRCGRTADGICIRLFSEEDYNGRELFTLPEIQRQNLAEVLLKMHSLGISDPDTFPFIDKPKKKSISEGYRILSELAALHKKGGKWSLTRQGLQMAHLPLDPKLSKILLEAARRGCLNQAETIVAVLSIQDPRERPQGKEKEADLAHKLHLDPDSDFLSLLNLWDLFHENRKTISLRRFCRDNFLSYRRMKEWMDIRRQISRILAERNIKASSKTKKPAEELHKSILSGFITHIAARKQKDLYLNAAGREIMIFPGSAVFSAGSDWIMSAMQVETSRLFARTAANIKAEWIEEAGAALCKKNYTDIRWDKNRAQVLAREKQSIFGMPLSTDAVVDYGKINPGKASEVFVREALVKGLYSPDRQTRSIPFLEHNRKLMDKIRGMENKNRKRDLLIDDESLFRLYHEKLQDIYSFALLAAAAKKNGPGFLCFKQNELMLTSFTVDNSLYPDSISSGRTRLGLKYEFIPDSRQDGLTLLVPLSESAKIDPDVPDWLVPGMIEEKIMCVLKGLPRQYRRKLVPLKESAALVTSRLDFGKGSFFTQLSSVLGREFDLSCSEETLKEVDIPDYLQARIALVDGKNNEIRASRSKKILTEKKQEASRQLEQNKSAYEMSNLTTWPKYDFGKPVTIKGKNNISAEFYPGLEAEGTAVNLKLFPSPEDRDKAHFRGVIVLALLQLKDQVKMIVKTDPLSRETMKYLKNNYPAGGIYDSMIKACLAPLHPKAGVFSENGFLAWLVLCREQIAELYAERKELLERTVSACSETEDTLKQQQYSAHAHKAVHDFLEARINQLKNAGGGKRWHFFAEDELKKILRWLKGLRIRSERGISNPAKDAEKEAEIAHVYSKAGKLKGENKAEYLLMLHALELAVFAPEVKGRTKISVKKLEDYPL